MMNLKPSIITICCYAHIFILSTALSANNSGYIRIMNTYGDTTPQFLPSSYVTSLPRWFLSDDKIRLERLMGTASFDPSNLGFVNPTSVDELWWPQDIQRLQVRPALDFLLKRGSITNIMAGLQVRVPPQSSQNGAEWKNYGLHSAPLAKRWTCVEIAYESNFKVELFVGLKPDGEDLSIPIDSNMRPLNWNQIGMNHGIEKVLENLGVFLANLEYDSPLLQGLQILSLAVDDTWLNLPPVLEFPGHTYQIASIATVESQARDLLNQDDSFVDLTAASVLRVSVSQTGSGSSSEYLTPAYKPLYHG